MRTPFQLLRPQSFATVSGTVGLFNQTPREVALRAVCTQLLLTRWTLESQHLSAPDHSTISTHPARGQEAFKALSETIRKTKIHDYMTSREKELMDKPYTKWEVVDDIIPVESRWESFGMLLWALRIFKDMPPFDQRFPHQDMYRATAIIPAFPNTVDSFIEYFSSGEGTKMDHIVSQTEFSTAVDKAEAWYWRARAQIVLDLKLSLEKDPEGTKEARKRIPSGLRNVMQNIDKAIEAASQRAVADHLIDYQVDGDFGVFDKVAYKNMSDHDVRDIGIVSEARLASLGWMTGTNEWDYVRGELKFIHPMGSLWSPDESE